MAAGVLVLSLAEEVLEKKWILGLGEVVVV
jgi:hypothetical protein